MKMISVNNNKVVVAVVALLFMCTSEAISRVRVGNDKCSISSSCGNISLSHPFTLKGGCGGNERLIEVSCDTNNHNRTILYVERMKFYVRDMKIGSVGSSFSDAKLWLVDASVVDSNDSCFVPSVSVCWFAYHYQCGEWMNMYYQTGNGIALLNCSKPLIFNSSSVVSHRNIYSVDTSSCSPNHSHYFYAVNGSSFTNHPSLLDESSCVVQATTPYPDPYYGQDTLIFPIPTVDERLSNNTSISLANVHQWLLNGFQAKLHVFTYQDCTPNKFKELGSYETTIRRLYGMITMQYWTNAADIYYRWDAIIARTITDCGGLDERIVLLMLFDWNEIELDCADFITDSLPTPPPPPDHLRRQFLFFTVFFD